MVDGPHSREHPSLGEGGRVAAPSLPASSFRSRLLARISKPKEGAEGKLWEATIIKAGPSLNGFNYSPEVLKEAVALFEGLPVFSYLLGDKQTHAPDSANKAQPGGFTGNRVGQIQSTWWNEENQSIDGLLAIDDKDTRTRLLNSHERGAIGKGPDEDVEGLSINAEGLREGEDVTRITRGESVELVTNPAAGGCLKRLVADHDPDNGQQGQEAQPKQQENEESDMSKANVDGKTEVREGAGEQIKVLASKLGAMLDDTGKALLEQIMGLVTGMQRTPGPPAAAVPARAEQKDDQRFAKAMESILTLAGHSQVKESEELTKAFGSAIAILEGKEPEDHRDETIRGLQKRLRESTIGRELDKLEGPLRIKDLDAVTRLGDFTGCKFSEDFSVIEGLKEAVEKTLKERPYLVEAEKLEESNEGKNGTDEDATEKPEPRGQNVRLTESVDGDADSGVTRKAIEARIASVMPYAESGDDRAILEVGELKFQLKRL